MNKKYLDSTIKEEISTYWSDDKTKKAIIINNYGELEIQYFKNDELEAIESYEDRSMQYHEDAAENYALGVKVFS